MRQTIDEEGKTRIRDLFVVSAPVAGKIRRSLVDPGDLVEENRTVLAVMEASAPPFLDQRSRGEAEAQEVAFAAAVDLARAEVEQAETELKWAADEVVRTRALARTSVVSQRAGERAELDLLKARATVARAQANLVLRQAEHRSARARLIGPETAGSELSCFEIRSPVSGRVLRELQESERIVPAGAPLFEVGDPARLDVVVELLSEDAVRVARGTTVVLEGTGLPGPLDGKVRLVEPTGFTKISALGVEEQRVRLFIDLASPATDWARLGHDFRVVARVTVWSADDVLTVPLSALFRSGSGWAVFTVRNGRAARTPVVTGHRNRDRAEITGGLEPGDTVVLYPSDRVGDGTRISVRTAPQ
jgi:HlyD family secretion protein